MAASAPAKAPPVFWRDLKPSTAWLADPELITRDELLSRLTAMGAPVTLDRLRRWEQDGLPRPERSGFPAKAWYPTWAVPYIAAVPALLAEGKGLPEITELIQSRASAAFLGTALRVGDVPIGDDLASAVDAYAGEHERRGGRPIAKVELIFRDDQGREVRRAMVGRGARHVPAEAQVARGG